MDFAKDPSAIIACGDGSLARSITVPDGHHLRRRNRNQIRPWLPDRILWQLCGSNGCPRCVLQRCPWRRYDGSGCGCRRRLPLRNNQLCSNRQDIRLLKYMPVGLKEHLGALGRSIVVTRDCFEVVVKTNTMSTSTDRSHRSSCSRTGASSPIQILSSRRHRASWPIRTRPSLQWQRRRLVTNRPRLWREIINLRNRCNSLSSSP